MPDLEPPPPIYETLNDDLARAKAIIWRADGIPIADIPEALSLLDRLVRVIDAGDGGHLDALRQKLKDVEQLEKALAEARAQLEVIGRKAFWAAKESNPPR